MLQPTQTNNKLKLNLIITVRNEILHFFSGSHVKGPARSLILGTHLTRSAEHFHFMLEVY